MVDFATAGIAAGLTLAQRLLYQWITKGKVRVKTSEVNAEIARAARDEADRLRLRVDDLETFTRRIIEQLVVIMPQMSYERPRLRAAELVLDYDPRDARSSKDFLRDLDAKVKLIADEVRLIELQPIVAPRSIDTEPHPDASAAGTAQFSLVDGSKEETTAGASAKSAMMLDELRKRVQERESPRQ